MIEHWYSLLRVIARDPRCARAARFRQLAHAALAAPELLAALAHHLDVFVHIWTRYLRAFQGVSRSKRAVKSTKVVKMTSN